VARLVVLASVKAALQVLQCLEEARYLIHLGLALQEEALPEVTLEAAASLVGLLLVLETVVDHTTPE